MTEDRKESEPKLHLVKLTVKGAWRHIPVWSTEMNGKDKATFEKEWQDYIDRCEAKKRQDQE